MSVASYTFVVRGLGFGGDSLAPATIVTWTPPNSNMIAIVTARCVAWDFDHSAGCGFIVEAAFRVTAGTITQIGTTTTLDSKIGTGSTLLVPTFTLSAPTGSITLLDHESVDTSSHWDAQLTITAYQYS